MPSLGVRLAHERAASRTGPPRPATRAAPPGGRSSPRSPARPLAAQRQTCRARKAGSPASASVCLEKFEVHPPIVAGHRNASRQIPRPCRRRLAARVRGDHRRRPRDRRRRASSPIRPATSTTRARSRSTAAASRPPATTRLVYVVNKPAGRRLHRQGPAGPAARSSSLVPSDERLYPGRPARLRHDRPDPADQRRRPRAPAHAPEVRGPAHLPRADRQRADQRARDARAARRRRARGRPDGARAGAPDQLQPHRADHPRGPQAPGQAHVRGGRPSGPRARARGVRAAAAGRAGARRAPRADARRRSSACANLVECRATCGWSRSEAPTRSPRTPPRRSSRRPTS